MTAHGADLRPPRSVPLEVRHRRAAVVTAALSAIGIAVVTLGPRWLVVDGVEAVRTLLALAGRPVDLGTLETAANAAMFVPLGASLGLAVRPRAWPVALLLAAAPSVGAELAQTRLPGRVPDPQDVLANTAGALAGLAVAVLVVGAGRLARRLRGSNPRSPRPGRARRSPAVPVLAGAALLLALALGAAALLHPSPGGRPSTPQVPALDAGGTAALSAEDGWIPDGASVSPFADVPAVARLDPALRRAVQQAASAAAADGVEVVLTSGRRSARYQQRLLDDAVARSGSREEAARARGDHASGCRPTSRWSCA